VNHSARSKTMLLVEDDPEDAAFALHALKEADAASEIILARDGEEAIDYFFGTGAYAGRDPALTPTVVILDLKLPKLTGLQVLERLRADPRTCHTPVVILTSSDEPKDVARSYDLGANSYVRKPEDFEAFTKAVRELCAYWLSLNLPPPHADHGEGNNVQRASVSAG